MDFLDRLIHTPIPRPPKALSYRQQRRQIEQYGRSQNELMLERIKRMHQAAIDEIEGLKAQLLRERAYEIARFNLGRSQRTLWLDICAFLFPEAEMLRSEFRFVECLLQRHEKLYWIADKSEYRRPFLRDESVTPVRRITLNDDRILLEEMSELSKRLTTSER